MRRARQVGAIDERRKKAWQLHLAGLGFNDIGAALGVSGKTAHQDVWAIFSQKRDGTAHSDEVELLTAQQNGQIDALIRSHWTSKEQKKSADVILRALERKARLNGLDKQRDENRPSWIQVEQMLIAQQMAMQSVLTRLVADKILLRSIGEQVAEEMEKTRAIPAQITRRDADVDE